MKELIFFSLLSINLIVLIIASRFKRFLIFPPSAPTRHQFIAGIGLPAELEDQSVTTGYVFKAQFYLPIDTFKSQLIPEFRQTRSFDLNNRTQYFAFSQRFESNFLKGIRWYTYNTMENLLNKFGSNGNQCILKLICESAGSFTSGMTMIEEIMNIILQPSSSGDEIYSKKGYQYLYAEHFGKSGKDCSKEFDGCHISILNKISLLIL